MAAKRQYQVAPTLTEDNYKKIDALCVLQKRTRNNMAAVLIDEALKNAEKDVTFTAHPSGSYIAKLKN